MKCKCKVFDVETVSGTSKATGKPFTMEVGTLLDLDTFDKIRLVLSDKLAGVLRGSLGKQGVADLGFDTRQEKLTFVSFAPASA